MRSTFSASWPKSLNVPPMRKLNIRLASKPGSTRDSSCEAADQEPRTGQQHDRQGDLHTDEQPLQRVAPRHLRAARIGQSAAQADAPARAAPAPSRRARHGDDRGQRVEQDAAVERQLLDARKIRREPRSAAAAPAATSSPSAAPGDGEHGRLDENLAT